MNSPRFKKVLKAAQHSSDAYKPPTKDRLAGDLLESTTRRLMSEEEPLRKACMADGATVVSDGWDDVEHNHLINFLVATQKGAFFDGTVKLGSEDHENAEAVAKHIAAEIEKVGALKIVQVVTDTCSVMKKAWTIIEKKFPWITCTCCAPHDCAEPAAQGHREDQGGGRRKVLNRFWERWCRTFLRETVLKNHKKKLGLYRAAPTRFAGHVKEMGRMLRLKADLKYAVDSPEYAKQDFKKKKGSEEADGDDDVDGEGGVKKILLDEEGFWKPLVEALKVPAPPARMDPTAQLPKPCVP